MNVLDDFGFVSLHMRLIVVLIGGLDSWMFQFANVDACSSSKIVEVVAKLLQVVRKIVTGFELLVKSSDLVLLSLLQGILLLLL